MTEQTKEVTFHHYLLEGSAYEVGRLQGDMINRMPALKQWIDGGKVSPGKVEFDAIRQQAESFCPGLFEEIQGCADALKIPASRIVYWMETYLPVNHCSHFAVLPSASTDGHLLVGRNYDFNDTMDDLTFATTCVEGMHAHIGSPGLIFGRNDGMNEHGLVVTMSTGGIPVGRFEGMAPPIQTGFMFWALVRTLLDRCRTVDEALALIDSFPCAGNPVLLLADQQGKVALVEIWGPRFDIKSIDAGSMNFFLCATNHFTLPSMIPFAPYAMNHSRMRYEAIASRLNQAAPDITLETARALLSDAYPEGLSTHFYEENFGTLHAIIFDATRITAEVCFGTPGINKWLRFAPRQATPPGTYRAILSMDRSTPDFWGHNPLLS